MIAFLVSVWGRGALLLFLGPKLRLDIFSDFYFVHAGAYILENTPPSLGGIMSIWEKYDKGKNVKEKRKKGKEKEKMGSKRVK